MQVLAKVKKNPLIQAVETVVEVQLELPQLQDVHVAPISP